ncbi:hypothetical protein ACJ41O_000843 [Fusarium nematophilum]
MYSSSSNNSSREEEKAALFGRLLSIPDSSILQLASNIRARRFGDSTKYSRVISRITGSYNVSYIVQLDSFKLVIRVPATARDGTLTREARLALESHAATLKFLEQKTPSIPSPRLYQHDTTFDNEISAPYICMSFLPGKNLDQTWYSSGDEYRKRALKGVAGFMAQLSQHPFDKIGSIYQDDNGGFYIGPGISAAPRYSDGGTTVTSTVDTFGPSTSASELLAHDYACEMAPLNYKDRAKNALMEAIMPLMPFEPPSEGFVLPKPDLDLQNVLVDGRGNVTALLDWDFATVSPRCIGNCGYPGWIWRDFDPMLYVWEGQPQENSPSQLRNFRRYYNEQLGRALGAGRSQDVKWNERSHMWQAIWLAAGDEVSRYDIVKKLAEVAIGRDVEVDMRRIGEGEYTAEEWDVLKQKLKDLIS